MSTTVRGHVRRTKYGSTTVREHNRTLHFKSKKAYDKWNAYRAMHVGTGCHREGDYPKVKIAGKPHKVVH